MLSLLRGSETFLVHSWKQNIGIEKMTARDHYRQRSLIKNKKFGFVENWFEPQRSHTCAIDKTSE